MPRGPRSGWESPWWLKGNYNWRRSVYTTKNRARAQIRSLPFAARLYFSGATTVIFFQDWGGGLCDLHSPICTPVTQHLAPWAPGHTLSIS